MQSNHSKSEDSSEYSTALDIKKDIRDLFIYTALSQKEEEYILKRMSLLWMTRATIDKQADA